MENKPAIMISRGDETKERGDPVPLALPELCCRGSQCEHTAPNFIEA